MSDIGNRLRSLTVQLNSIALEVDAILDTPTNKPPIVALTSPAEGASFTAPATIQMAASASDDKAVKSVEFFIGTTSVGLDTTAPYTAQATGVGVGSYVLTAKAKDADGAEATSAPRTVLVKAAVPPPPTGGEPALTFLEKKPIGTLTKPALGGTVIDSASGRPMKRLTKDNWRTDYSRRRFWCAGTGDKILAYKVNDGGWGVFNAATGALIRLAPFPSGKEAEPIWHPIDPDLIFYRVGLKWLQWSVSRNTSELVFDFAGKLPFGAYTHVWTRYEGDCSKDATKLFLFATNYIPSTGQVQTKGMACLDLINGRLHGYRASTLAFDHCGTSIKGNWGIYSGDNTVAWSPDFSTSKIIMPGGQHSDTVLGPNGEDMFITSMFGGSDDGWVMLHDMDANTKKRLIWTYHQPTRGTNTMHLSGRCWDRQGYAVLSTYNDKANSDQEYPVSEANREPLSRKVMIVKLDTLPEGDARITQHIKAPVWNVAHIHGAYPADYFNEPQAVPNANLTKIAVNSNMGSGALPDTYEVAVPWS